MCNFGPKDKPKKMHHDMQVLLKSIHKKRKKKVEHKKKGKKVALDYDVFQANKYDRPKATHIGKTLARNFVK